MSSTSFRQSPRKHWALVDCNNSYASCEKLFRPDLADRPVVALSNNDGCIVARTQEAKALGIPMGAPEFKVRHLLREHRVMELVAGGIAVHIRTSRHDEDACDQTAQCPLPVPTDDSRTLLKAASYSLAGIYEKGYAYAIAGIRLYDLHPRHGQQASLLTLTPTYTMDSLKALDKINARHGRHTLRYGAEGPDNADWHMQQKRRSPRMTTSWEEIPVVVCK